MAASAYDIVMSNRKEIVDKLIEQMKKGYAFTQSEWISLSAYNPVADISYKAGNRLRLMIAAKENGYKDPRWLTFKQAKSKEWNVKKGSHGVMLEKWIFTKQQQVLDDKGKPIYENGKPLLEEVTLKRPVVNYFKVFNGEQIEGIPELKLKEVNKDEIYNITNNIIKSSKCEIDIGTETSAFYRPSEDKVYLPLRESFKNNEAFLSVLLHEMSHSTGHESRLNREIKNSFGSIAYAKEELNAEIGSLFTTSDLGIKIERDSELIKDHSNYVSSWIKVLEDDPDELFRACANANKISNFLIENYKEVIENEKIVTLTPEETITKEMKKSGLNPTKDIVSKITSLNKITGKTHSLKDIAESYRDNIYKDNPKAADIINDIGNKLKIQELQNNIGIEV